MEQQAVELEDETEVVCRICVQLRTTQQQSGDFALHCTLVASVLEIAKISAMIDDSEMNIFFFKSITAAISSFIVAAVHYHCASLLSMRQSIIICTSLSKKELCLLTMVLIRYAAYVLIEMFGNTRRQILIYTSFKALKMK